MRLIKKNSTGSYNEYSTDDGTILKSYAVFVAKKTRGQVQLDEKYWDYSVTTSRHIGKFLDDSMANIRKLIKQGVIQLVNLN